ncbi:glycosyltransferase [Nostoc sp. FACHB-152]|uniref:glycosyltransferase n=1 Tax=unclassified Nostoc TaxID=2593658 RepID=UPI001681F3E5|nr:MULTISPECIES: glycosyltransferase [unclassified Nostoc]MBD2451331.1 glycosyltransferase [Nostoc sp. FACHB-152]MBD2466292.1 glycosyltransferase [Nostoc sp. FACHB-145]
MKIFLVASECPPVPGGIATYVGNTAAMFADAGHEITVFARSPQPGIEQKNNLKFIKIVPKDNYLLNSTKAHLRSENHPAFPYNVMGYWGAVSYQLAQEVINYIRTHGQPDIIESEDYSGIAYFLLQKKLLGCPELQGVPIVLNLHSPQYLLYPADKMPSYHLSDYWVGRMEKFCILAADGVFAPTHYIAQQVKTTLNPDLDIEIIPLPATQKLLNQEQFQLSSPTPKDIVYFGRLEVRKGIIPLLEACRQLWNAGMDFNLTAIGGDTWYHLQGCSMKGYLTEKYSKYINSGRLTISPPLPQTQLYERVKKAWCVVLPSIWENFPNSCLESMLLGKAILASSGVGHVEMLQTADMTAGVIFDWHKHDDFAQKLNQILSYSTTEILEIGQKARTLILNITAPENVLAKRVAHLKSVIANHQDKSIFPSLNYPPHGKVAYPTSLVETTDLGIKDRISVCIPFYNAGKYISETLHSVFASSYSDLEVIIFNDGSTDKTSIETLEVLEQTYKNLKIIHSENMGVSTARNKMAEIASGEYIAFLDADDQVSPNFYIQAAKVLRQYQNVGFVASWIKEFGASEKVWVAWNTEFPYLLCHNTLGVCTVVRKAAYLAAGGMKSLLAENLEDYECWLNMCEKGWLGVVIPELHYFYRIRSDSRLQKSNREQLLYLYEVIAALHPQSYQDYGAEIYHLLNQNGASWLWDNPSQNTAELNVNLNGMEILSLVSNKLKKVYSDGGISLILNRCLLMAKSLMQTRN